MRLASKKMVVIGGSRGVGRVIVTAAHAEGAEVLSVARRPEPLAQLAAALPGVRTLALDATGNNAPERVFDTLSPDILVLCGGALPSIAPLHEQTWEGFSRNWEIYVKTSFLFGKAALLMPLAPGAVVVFVSSGAALGGSTISGGYAGAKRMQMFLADYCQRESDRLKLDLRFLALLPKRIMPETELGKIAVAGYSEYLGITPADFVQSMDGAQTPDQVAEAVLTLATEPKTYEGSVFAVSSEGIARVP